ncbi:hypothetical protein [Bradyrhizobium sp. RDI18]|uniref:hypothetical protein n=1 Tax=Bradyrhizobium sp. RDI18 TaxID=3367400 RepID=UPI0037225AD7
MIREAVGKKFHAAGDVNCGCGPARMISRRFGGEVACHEVSNPRFHISVGNANWRRTGQAGKQKGQACSATPPSDRSRCHLEMYREIAGRCCQRGEAVIDRNNMTDPRGSGDPLGYAPSRNALSLRSLLKNTVI